MSHKIEKVKPNKEALKKHIELPTVRLKRVKLGIPQMNFWFLHMTL
jgi:hypothetical protein